MKYKKYKKYKNSKIFWLNDIPFHWNIGLIKHHFINNKQIAGTLSNSYERLSLTLNGVIKRSKTDAEGLQPEKFETYQIIKKNSLIFKLIDLENIKTSRVGLSPFNGIVSPAYITLQTFNSIIPQFAEYYFLNMWYEHIFNKLGSSGVRSNLNKEDLLNLNIIYPNLSEQEQIAKYLNHKTSTIEKTITKNKKLIELLKEKRTSLINQTVTKGLNPEAKMKESGIDWIGKIPEHWDLSRLKFNISKNAQYGANKEPEKDENKQDVRYIRITDIDDNGILKNSKVYLNNKDAKEFILNKDDILFARSGATVGKAYLHQDTSEICCYAGYLIRYVPNNKLSSKFLLYYTQSESYWAWIRYVSTQSTIENVSADKYNELLLPLPTYMEQKKIVDCLDKKSKKIDKTIEKIERNIELLEEYKESLIHHVVTGKIDVRGVEV